MTNSYFPLGTVVIPKESDRPMMICGYLAKDKETGVVKDYFAYPYPEGCADSSIVYQFNHEAVAQIICMGYQDTETNHYLRLLHDHGEEYKKKTQED